MMYVWLLVGVVVGVVTALLVAWGWGGLTYLGLRIVVDGERRPGAAEVASSLAPATCLAHALILDESGRPGAAGLLVMLSRTAGTMPMRHIWPAGRDTRELLRKYKAHLRHGTLGAMSPGEAMPCSKHGESRWGGHIRCLACRRAYSIQDDPPTTCECGWRLLPAVNHNGEPLSFTAAPICRHCYDDAPDDSPDGQPPTPEEHSRPMLWFDGALRWGRCPECRTELFFRFPDADSDRVPRFGPPSECPICGHEEPEGEEDSLRTVVP